MASGSFPEWNPYTECLERPKIWKKSPVAELPLVEQGDLGHFVLVPHGLESKDIRPGMEKGRPATALLCFHVRDAACTPSHPFPRRDNSTLTGVSVNVNPYRRVTMYPYTLSRKKSVRASPRKGTSCAPSSRTSTAVMSMLDGAKNPDSASVELGITRPGEPLSVGNTPIGVATEHGVSLVIQGGGGKRAVLVLTPQEAIDLGGSIQSKGIEALQLQRDA